MCKNLVPLVNTIEATPGALEALQTHFKAKSWLSPTVKINANELAALALSRIENNVKEYNVFMEMLGSVIGMDQIADTIKGL